MALHDAHCGVGMDASVPPAEVLHFLDQRAEKTLTRLLEQWLMPFLERHGVELIRLVTEAPAGASGLVQAGYVLLREAPGLLVMGAYLLLLPPLLAVTIFRGFFAKLGFVRYMVMANLMLLMLTLPIKMILRWTLNLKYIISIPEISLNF